MIHFSKHSEPAHIAAVLNWLGPKSYQVFSNLSFDAEGKEKSKIDDLFMFEKHFKPTQSVLQLWYQLGSIYSSQCKDQVEFMSKLHDVANHCSFANKDEIVKSITQMRGFKDQLIQKMKTTDILNWLKLLNQWYRWRHYLSSYSRMLENWIQPLKCMVSRNVTTVKTNISNQILEVPVVGNHPAGTKMERSVVIVVITIFQSNVLPMAKNVLNAKEELKTMLKI